MENKINREDTLFVWDAEGSPPIGNWTTVLWSDFGNDNDPEMISIPTLVEKQAYALRARYLAWIYELGETLIRGKRLVDHLELRTGLSYWWMTSLAQKFNISGTSQIENAIKAFALESLVTELKPKSIVLVSGNRKIALTLQRFCKNTKLHFKWNCVKSAKNPAPAPILRRIYNCLPTGIRSFAYFLWYVYKKLPLLRPKNATVPTFNGEITFIDVLAHLDQQTFTTGKFISNYWTSFIDKLCCSNIKTNWLHNYFYQKTIPDIIQAQKLVECFTQCSGGYQTHYLIEANLSASVLIKALKDYFRTSLISSHFYKASQNFRPVDSELDFWPLFKQEWINSLKGQDAIANCLRISLYEKTLCGIPYQRLGVYIQENQPWEMALIYAWKAAGHGELIGAPHSTVRFWDLRYFYDSRNYESIGINILPIPDLVAVNGPVAKKAYLQGGYPEDQITEVEALRFLHILDLTPVKPPSKSLNVLVCGDFLSTTNYKILSWLSIAAQSLPPETVYVLKPHPAYPFMLSAAKHLTPIITDAPLSELLIDADVVFTSNITSVSVDAYCKGIPVVQILDGSTFNLSPLRGLNGVSYVTNPMELTEELRNTKLRKRKPELPYFFLDKELPRWKKLIRP